MKWWGALSCLLVTQGLAQGPQGSPAPQCHVRCIQVYSGHHSEFQQVSTTVMVIQSVLSSWICLCLYVAVVVLGELEHLAFVLQSVLLPTIPAPSFVFPLTINQNTPTPLHSPSKIIPLQH